ncbi:unnamed protein product [Calypogeia fissa]
MTVTASLGKYERWDADGDQLIPGIPNEITLDHITPKLPWVEFSYLSIVSKSWLSAIRGRHVHDARVRSGSMDPLALVLLTCVDGMRTVALYSMRDKSWVALPPIPDQLEDILEGCQCVSLDGKVYVLGGRFDDPHGPGTDAVYVLDVAGQKPWEKCANMSEPRESFGCGVFNGKIYVFGGMSPEDPVSGSEVYDPKENIWSPISPMTSLRFSHSVEIVGEELFLHNGSIWDPDSNDAETSDYMDVYHPGKNVWRQVTPFGISPDEVLFVAKGKFYSMGHYDIHVLDSVNTDSWTYIPSASFQDAVEWPGIFPRAATLMDGEILAIFSLWDLPRLPEYRLLQSRGFQGGKGAIVWEQVEVPLLFVDNRGWYEFNVFRHPMHL